MQLCCRVCHQEVSGKPGWLEIKSTYHVLVYADDVNILGGSVHTIKKNSEALVIARKEIGLEVNGDKPKYMVMSECRTKSQNED